MDAATVLSPDLVLVLPPEERRRAIAQLAAIGPPTYFTPRPSGPPAVEYLAPRAGRAIVRYAIYKSVVATAWYIVFALMIGLVVVVLALH